MKYTDAQLHELKARALFAQSNGIQLAGALDHLVVVIAEVLEHRAAACCQEPKQEEPKQEEPKQEEPKQEEPKQEEPKQEEPAPDLVPPAPLTSPVLEVEGEAPEAPKPKGGKKK